MFLRSGFGSNHEELPQMVENPLRKQAHLHLTIGIFANGSTILEKMSPNTGEFSEIWFGRFCIVERFANQRMTNSNWYCGQNNKKK